MTIPDKLAEIRRFLLQNADNTLALKNARFFKEGYDACGVERKRMETQQISWLKAYSGELGFEGFLELGDHLVRSGKYEEGSLAIFFAAAFRRQFTPDTLDRLGTWLDWGFRNWAHTDSFCGEVLSCFLRDTVVPLESFSGWRDAASRWKRRAVPVTSIHGLRAGIPVPHILEFLTPMMMDDERVVHQGLGWFLKEAWKRSPAPVEAHLTEWKDSCNRLIIRMACEKMPLSRKAAFKKGKN